MEGSNKQTQRYLRWLKLGIGLKRWLLLLGIGVGLLSLGGAFGIRSFYPLPRFFYYLTLQFLPSFLRAVILIGLGTGCIIIGFLGLNRTLLKPFIGQQQGPLSEILYQHLNREKGPRIVVLGGGHGQAAILRGLKAYTSNITAIVTVADDGGSSGRLRRDLGLLPPGDFRNCIAALSNDESLVTHLFQYRFSSGAGLEGHSFGNLFITAMAGVTGSFETALKESSQVLAVRGRVLPCTLQAVNLAADIKRGQAPPVRIYGESKIPEARGHIVRVMLDPSDPPAYPEAVQAILNADMVVAGPGSLYTSILPNLLVPEIIQALRVAKAPKVYICNVATQVGETDNYTAEDHLKALEQHLGLNPFSAMIINNHELPIKLPEGVEWVKPMINERPGLKIIQDNIVDARHLWRHNSEKVAAIIQTLL
ncbi:MAG: YvcK family protein [Anaerolineae bacterium]|nr:YvcK family protein [Anaerolineae bacterium]